MNDREKLVELVCEVIQTEECNRHCNHPPCDMASDIADHLLSHGVTIREPGEQSDDDCFREKIEHQLKGIYEHLGMLIVLLIPSEHRLCRCGKP